VEGNRDSPSLVDDILCQLPHVLSVRLPFGMHNEVLCMLFVADLAHHQPRIGLAEVDSLNLLFSGLTRITESSSPRTPEHHPDLKAARKDRLDGAIDIRHWT